MLNRRSFIGSLLAMPAVIRTPGLLMPVKSVVLKPVLPVLPVLLGEVANSHAAIYQAIYEAKSINATLLIWDDVIYHQNSLGDWFERAGDQYRRNGWIKAAGDPRIKIS